MSGQGGDDGVDPSEARVILVTAPDLETAERLADGLVGASLAACVNLVPKVRSIYRWEGSVERAEEVLMIVKTVESRVADVIDYTGEHHPYDVPEALALPVSRGLPSYVDWVVASCRPPSGGESP